MSTLTTHDLFKSCPPSRDLSFVVSQYLPEIEYLKKAKAGIPIDQLPPPPRGGYEMVKLVQSRLTPRTNVVSFKPFELLIRIHQTVYGEDGLGNKTIQEVSYPIHYGPKRKENEIVVATEPLRFPTDEPISDLYGREVEKTIRNHSKELVEQRATYEDIILINRRLIEHNIRCIPCRTDRSIKCFRFDWIKKELL